MPKTAIIFPGQGAQTVGMGADFAAAHRASRDVFQQASDILGWNVLDVCTHGPQERLSATDVQQPAILATSAAIVAAIGPLKDIQPQFSASAGLSLGEYGALYFAGALSLADALRLVRERGRFMQEAADAVPSSMVSLVGADESTAESICRDAAKGDVLVVANLNCPGQVVISGGKEACDRAVQLADTRGLRGDFAFGGGSVSFAVDAAGCGPAGRGAGGHGDLRTQGSSRIQRHRGLSWRRRVN